MSRRAVHDGLFDLADDGTLTLLGGRCGSCDRPHFPRLDTCPLCGAAAITGQPLSRTGALWGWTTVTAAPPGYEGPVPFGFGVIELPEGLRVVTRITETDPAALTFGQPMVLVADVVATVDDEPEGPGGPDEPREPVEVVAWAFAPATGAPATGDTEGDTDTDGDGPGVDR